MSRNTNVEILKEMRFMLPECNPSGELKEELHASLEETLLSEFGGFFTSLSEAIRKDPDKGELVHDDVICYRVPLQHTRVLVEKLETIILKYANELEQDFVYIKYPNGEAYYKDV